jgi:preprotein translocase subunit YajC
MFITQAFAQDAAAQTPGSSDMLFSILPFVAIFAILYFLMIRPQQRRFKDHQNMVSNLRRGDVVVMTGGLIGKINKLVDDNEAILEIDEGIKVRVIRSSISEVRGRTEPVQAANDENTSSLKEKNKKSA